MKRSKNILAYLNIIISLILLTILLFCVISDNVIYVMIMTLFIGWAIPYFVLIITGIVMIKNSHHRLGLISNLCCLILSIILIILCIKQFDKYMISLIIEYTIIIVFSIINTISYIKYLKSHPNLETKKIKEIKNKNNGAIV